MSNNNTDTNGHNSKTNEKIIHLKQNENSIARGLIRNAPTYNIDTENVRIPLNHATNDDILFTIDKKKWQNNYKILFEQAEEYGIHDINDKLSLRSLLNDNEDLLLANYNQESSQTKEEKEEEEEESQELEKKEKPKRPITTFKYSRMGKGDLREAVYIEEGKPVFIKYNAEKNQFESTNQIEETTRILVPPTYEECPYIRLEFESLDEINSYNKFLEQNNIGLDYFYYNGLEIVSKYNNQSKHKLILVTIKIITSHFQDRFPTTEYLYPVGGNGSGKSSLAETFRAIAYKTVVMTDPSAANLFRLLGFVEPVQCTMVLEEADKIDKLPELMAVLKTGSSYYGTVSKINPYTLKPEYFFSYCPKIIVSERSLSQSIAKGVNSRTFPINCVKGSTKHDILEVLNPDSNVGGPQKDKLYQELMNYRKLLLVYRLRHFNDPIPDLDIGVEGRDKQLVKHSVQLFYGCKCLNEVIETLQKFLDIKNEKKESTIESVLLRIVATLIKFNGPKLSSKSIWDELMNEIPGMLNEKNPNEYHTDDYGTIYRTTTMSNYLGDSFGGVVKHTKKGNVWTYDPETIQRLVEEDRTKIVVKEVKNKEGEDEGEDEGDGEGVNTVNTASIGGSSKNEKNEAGIETEESLEREEDEETLQEQPGEEVELIVKGFQLSPDGPIHLEEGEGEGGI